MRSHRQEPSDDQLALFSLDDEREPSVGASGSEPESAEPAPQDDVRPSSLREALQRRREAWERRREEDPEGVAAEEEAARTQAAQALRLYTGSTAFQRWTENQARTQRLITGANLLRAQDAAHRSGLAQIQRISAGFRTPDLTVGLRTQVSGIIKGAVAGYPSQSVASAMAQSIGINDVVGKQAGLITRGVLAQFPSGSIADSFRTVVNTNFTPSAATSLSLIGSQVSLQLGMQAASIANPALEGVAASLRAIGIAHGASIRNIISQIGEGVTFPRGLAIDALRLGGRPLRPLNIAPYSAQLVSGAIPIIQQQERLAGLLRETLKGLPPSLIAELATLTDVSEPPEFMQPQTLGATSLIAPPRSLEILERLTDSLITAPRELAELYAQAQTQRLIAHLLLYYCLMTGDPTLFFTLLGYRDAFNAITKGK